MSRVQDMDVAQAVYNTFYDGHPQVPFKDLSHQAQMKWVRLARAAAASGRRVRPPILEKISGCAISKNRNPLGPRKRVTVEMARDRYTSYQRPPGLTKDFTPEQRKLYDQYHHAVKILRDAGELD